MDAHPANSINRPDLQPVVNYAIVALVGMLAGILVGYVFGTGAKVSPGNPALSVPHPRALNAPSP